MLPDFLIIGAMKAGTTTLWAYLRSHPGLYLPSKEEIDFFSRHWDRGTPWYEEWFAGAPAGSLIGERSTSYAKYPEQPGVPERMASLVPEARLVYLVRHPLERMRSHYLHRRVMGTECRPIERALREHPSYLAYSRYWLQLEQYLEHFSPRQIMVVVSERLCEDRDAVLESICRFLGVEASWRPDPVDQDRYRTARLRVRYPWVRLLRRLPGYRALGRLAPPALRRLHHGLTTRRVASEDPGTGEIPPALRAELEEAVRDDVRRLRAFLGPEFHGWGIA